MRLRERARVSAALAQCALIRCRRELRLDLLNLLPDKINHKSFAWREMPSRWITSSSAAIVQFRSDGRTRGSQSNQGAPSMGLVRFALRFPHTFYVVAGLMLFVGSSAILITPKDIYPKINIPWSR
jgi:hypothetical protein